MKRNAATQLLAGSFQHNSQPKSQIASIDKKNCQNENLKRLKTKWWILAAKKKSENKKKKKQNIFQVKKPEIIKMSELKCSNSHVATIIIRHRLMLFFPPLLYYYRSNVLLCVQCSLPDDSRLAYTIRWTVYTSSCKYSKR